jgi:TP901 family phage tail tape measure protein
MQIRINGSANLSQVRAEFAALEAQVTGLNAAMAKTASTPVMNPKGYQNYTAAVQAGSKAWRDSLASTGLFRVEQQKLSAATEHYTDLLQRQKLSFRQVFGKENRALMRSIYQEQLKLHDLQARPANKNGMFDVAVPRMYRQELDTLNRRLNFTGAQLKSAGTHMVNFGKNTQWAGRQLTVGLTMPVVALGAAAAVMAYKVDMQMTRVRKVYDTTADQSSTNMKDMMAVQAEFAQLNKDSWNTVTDATKRYASSAADTLGVQAELAATGMKGARLQKATTEVMKSAMLGEIDYQTATSATIALQQQLHLSTMQLSDSWAYMNSVENSTSLQMKDFAAAIPIALGPIRQMGGDLQDLGTLMTAMISRGVQVGKAANAIKALPQRLSRPSKQVQEEFKTLTGQDIVELNKKNPNNIIGLLTDIEHATMNLDTLSRRKALAGLFGTFQLSTMSSMLEGMKDLENQTGQTYKAFQIGEQTTKDWRQISEQEIGQMQKSVSFRFKRMVNDVKNAAVEFGRPFLEVAIDIGNVVVGIMDKFSALPKIFKMIAAGGLAITAIAGPTLMLIGLLGNLAGNGMKVIGSILSMGKAMVLTTTSERAMTKAHMEEQAAMVSATRSVENQALMLDLLTQANTKAEAATMAFWLANSGAPTAKIRGALADHIALTEKDAAALLKDADAYRVAAIEAQKYHETLLARAPAGTRMPAQSMQAQTLNAKYMATTQEAALLMNAERDAAKSSSVVAQNTEKTRTGMAGAATAGTVMAASMATMMVTSNKTANSIAQWALISSMVIPAIKAANAGVVLLGARMAALRGASMLSMTAMRGFAGAAAAAIGPVGLVVAAVTAIGVIAYKIWQHNKKITEEHNKQSDILSKQNRTLDEQLGLTQKLQRLTPTGVPSRQTQLGGPSVPELADALYASKSGKDLINTYKAGDDIEKQTLAVQTYMDALNAVGGSADKARKKVEALMLAAGEGSVQAQTDARQLANLLGSAVSPEELAVQWGKQMQSALDETSKAASKTGDTLGKRMADAIARGGPGAADKFLTAMQQQVDQQYKNVLMTLPTETIDYFKKLGITSAKQFDEALADYSNMDMSQKSMEAFAKKWHITTGQIEGFIAQIGIAQGEIAQPLQNIHDMEAGIAEQISSQLRLAKNANDLDEIRASWAFKLLNINKENAALTYFQYVNSKKILDPMGTLNDMLTGQTDQQKLTLAQQAAQAAGLKVVNTLAEQERILSEAAKGNFITSENAIGGMAGGLSKVNALLAQSVNFTKDQIAGMRKTAAQGVTEDVASALQAGFDARQRAAQDSLQSYWDKRIATNDRMAEKETNHLERKWDRLHKQTDAKWDRRKDAMTAYYDKRIEGIDKAIEAEQAAEDLREKIFEAEKTRIERLNQMANTNIDFNTAINSGNLDEAAKIRNNMQATVADWALTDAGTAGKDASDARVKTLTDQKDLLEKQKDQALKNLEALEKANQASLDKREKQEKAHLERMQKARANDLQRQQQQASAALANRQAREAAAFDQRLTLFKSYIARDQKDLENWMAEVGVSYDQFGANTRKKGETWSTWFQDSMTSHLRAAGRQIMSDNMWAAMGKAGKKAMLHAMGFKSLKEFGKFIQTGELPDDYGSRNLNEKAASPTNGAINDYTNKPKVYPNGETRHAGGEVGSGMGSRVGVARSLKTLHPTETLITAQRGEFLVNRRAAQEYKPLLEAINAGDIDPNSRRNVGHGVGGDMGVQTPGIGMGIMATMMLKGMTNAMMQKKEQRSAGGNAVAGVIQALSTAGLSAVGGIGGYQRASIPGKGWVNSHDYRNGLGSPLFAADDGRIIESRAITSGGSPGNGLYPTPYRSFGETIVLQTAAGDKIRYAHLNPGQRFVSAGQIVKGGALIGRSGMTGNATGPHTHFEINGMEIAREWFKSHGIGLDSGGYTTRDGMANLHKDEVVIDSSRTADLYKGLDTFTSLMDSVRNIGNGTGGTGSSTDFGVSRLFGVGDQTEFTPHTNVNKPPTGTTGGTPTDSGKAMTLRTGAFNLFNHLSAKAQIADLKQLIKKADVLSLSEYNHGKVGEWLRDHGWGLWDGHKGDTALAWNRKVVNGLHFGTQALNPHHYGPAGLGHRFAEYGLFRDKKSGRQFYQASIHTVPRRNATHNVGTVKQRNAIQKEQAQNIQKLYNRLRKSGKPVVMGGDINKFIAAMLKHDIHGAGNNTFQIFGNLDSSKSSMDYSGYNSDHPAVFAKYNIPGLRTGGYTMSDGLANLHQNELVVDPARTKILLEGIDNLAAGTNANYNVHMHVNGEVNADVIVGKVVTALERMEARKPQSRRGN